MTTKFVHNNHAQLDTKNLNVYINGAQILKDVNVSIPKGKITCIIGPSGCGKSTLLRTFNRLNDRVEGLKMNGEVNLGDNNILEASSSKLSEVRRNIGLVPQRPCPLPMSIYDNVAYGCRIHGIRNKKKLDSIEDLMLSNFMCEPSQISLKQPDTDYLLTTYRFEVFTSGKW